MDLIDVNILVYAYRQESPDHDAHRQWLEDVINADQAYGISDHVLAGFLRVVTHPSVFDPPSSFDDALDFAIQVRDQAGAVSIQPGPHHWEIFTRLCRESGARGNLIPDAFLAALAIETGSDWVTTDQDYSRFNGLKWRHPLRG